LTDDPQVRLQAVQKIDALDMILQGYHQQVEDAVNAAIFEHDSNKKAEAEDILTIYHDFACRVKSLQEKSESEKTEVARDPGAAEAWLQNVMEEIQKDYRRDCDLRAQLHAALDETYTTEGLP